MKKKLQKLIFLLVSILTVNVHAQNLITPITISLPTNPPANTAEWATALPPVMITAQTRMLNGQISPIVIESRVLVTIKSAGGKVCGTYTAQNAPMSGFSSATKVWSGANVVSLLGQDCILKAGSYEMCVQFYGLTPAQAGLIGEACKAFTIKDNSEGSYSPPTNISPTKDKILTEKEAKAPLTFRWTPVLPKPREAVTYRLKVWQLMQGQNGIAAMKANRPVVEKDVKDITQFVKPNLMGDVEMFGNKEAQLVWNVEAISATQSGEKSLGISEPSMFRFGGSGLSAASCCPGLWASINGGTSSSSLTYDLLASGGVLPSLPVGSTYFVNTCYTCGPSCGTPTIVYELYDFTNTLVGASVTDPTGCNTLPFTIPSSLTVGGGYTFKILAYCGGAICDSAKFQFTPSAAANCCTGGSWSSLTLNSIPISTTAGTFAPVNINAPINLNSVYNCASSASCTGGLASIIYVVTQGTYTATYTSAPLAPPTVGASVLTVYVKCGTDTCERFSYQFMTKSCCGTWGNKSWGNTAMPSTPLPPSFTFLGNFNACTIKYFNLSYNCAPGCGPAVFSYKILTSALTTYSAGTITGSTPVTMPNTAGSYVLRLYASCGGTICDSLEYKFTIFVNCCLGSSWGAVTVARTPLPPSWATPYNFFAIPTWSWLPVHSATVSTFNVTYKCAGCCTPRIKITIYRPGYSTTTTWGMSGVNIPITMPTLLGLYRVRIDAYCGGVLCNTVIRRIRIVP